MNPTPHPAFRPGAFLPTALLVLGTTTGLAVAAAVGLALPGRALVAIATLGLLVGALTRTGLWLVGRRTGRDADVLAVLAGSGTMAAALALAGLVLLLGAASVDVLATTFAVAALYLALTRAGTLLDRR